MPPKSLEQLLGELDEPVASQPALPDDLESPDWSAMVTRLYPPNDKDPSKPTPFGPGGATSVATAPEPERTLLQKNAKILAELEEAWAELGSIRQIDFYSKFSGDDTTECVSAAQIFATRARNAGFQVAQFHDGFFETVTASIRIAPTAERVTELQLLLESFIDFVKDPPDGEDPSVYLQASEVGWGYPPAEVVSFYPDDKPSRKGYAKLRDSTANARFRAMTGTTLVKDPLHDNGSYHIYNPMGPNHNSRTSFKLVSAEFLRTAQSLRPSTPLPTASAFSQWVYSLYGRGFGEEEDRASGTKAETEIWERRKRSATDSIDNDYLRRAGSDWRLTYNGLHLRGQQYAEYFTIPHLVVNNEGLRASPDLIYSSHDGSELIIVEIKFSQQPIPRNLWPNIWAQLWCYAQLDSSLRAKNVTVIGEIWGSAWPRTYAADKQKIICLRALVRRDPRVEAFDRFFRRLFDIYSGRF